MKLLLIQPIIPSYRLPVVQTLARNHHLTILAEAKTGKHDGFCTLVPECADFVHTRIFSLCGGRFFWQSGVVRNIVRRRPDVVFVFANLRFISYWLALLTCRVLGRKVLSHGQGLHSRPSARGIRRLLYRIACRLSTRYVCYTESGHKSLLSAGCSSSKLIVADNSLSLSATVRPTQKTYRENGVLFIGRVRKGSGLHVLVDALERLRGEVTNVHLHVVGDGEDGPHLKTIVSQHPWIHWHGAIYDEFQIRAISLDCRIGCYPGDAGLSIVHFFGLSLPPVVHGTMHEHGPEPSYVRHSENGFLYARNGGSEALFELLKEIWRLESSRLAVIGKGAFATYEALNSPPLGYRLLAIINREWEKDSQ